MPRTLMVAILCCCSCLALSAEESCTLVDFGNGFDFGKVEAKGAKAARVDGEKGAVLRVSTGHDQDWPGITIPAPLPELRWDLTTYTRVELDVKNVGNNQVTVRCRVDNRGADGRKDCCSGGVTLEPGARGALTIEIKRREGGFENVRLFGMRGYPGAFAQNVDGTIDPAQVNQLLIYVGKPKEDHVFEIERIRALGTYVAPTEARMDAKQFFPFIDTFGQYIHRDWPGKIHSMEEMAARALEEEKELAAKPGPEAFDAWGGWKDGPTLKSTGFFRVEKHEGKWWLVDPDGKLFFSHGLDGVRPFIDTPTDDRAAWFKDFPGERPEFKECVRRQDHVVRDYYKGKTPLCFDFGIANLKRKYGDEWVERFADSTHRRMRSWGLNTIANWSDPRVYLKRKTPYVVAIHTSSKVIQGSQGYWGQFRDPFEPEFREALNKRLQAEVGQSAKDSWCIGYFVDNELGWGDETSLALAALASPPDQAAKKAFIEDLKKKYGEIDKLNASWGTGHASWDALLQEQKPADQKKAHADLVTFYEHIADEYFRNCREAVKTVAPDNLYLGCRFAWVNPVAARVATKHCDVVSFNLYRDSVANYKAPFGDSDVPLIIGEFHFGALDRGLFHTGLRATPDQKARATAYRNYVTGALKHPQFVGTHWFIYRDQATTGRPLDGENYQIGFVDVCDTPYAETIEACREVGYRMYQIRAGKE